MGQKEEVTWCWLAGRGKIGASLAARFEGNGRLCTSSINTVTIRLSGSNPHGPLAARPFQGTKSDFRTRRWPCPRLAVRRRGPKSKSSSSPSTAPEAPLLRAAPSCDARGGAASRLPLDNLDRQSPLCTRAALAANQQRLGRAFPDVRASLPTSTRRRPTSAPPLPRCCQYIASNAAALAQHCDRPSCPTPASRPASRATYATARQHPPPPPIHVPYLVPTYLPTEPRLQPSPSMQRPSPHHRQPQSASPMVERRCQTSSTSLDAQTRPLWRVKL